MASWFILTLTRWSSNVKVIGQSEVQPKMMKKSLRRLWMYVAILIVCRVLSAIVVDATSIEGLLVPDCFYVCSVRMFCPPCTQISNGTVENRYLTCLPSPLSMCASTEFNRLLCTFRFTFRLIFLKSFGVRNPIRAVLLINFTAGQKKNVSSLS